MSLEQRWKNDGLLPDAIDLRLVGGWIRVGQGGAGLGATLYHK